jgi:pimeloyl-ACP methyl ester carboxylesterase
MEIFKENGFEYIEQGSGEPLILLHGLFGALSNWEDVVSRFSENYRVIIPLLPIYTMPLRQAGLSGLNKFVEDFIEHKEIPDYNLIGNSLGGHVGLIHTLANPTKVKRLILTGSSGLFENSMGASYPKRGSYDFVKEKVGYTFYDPSVASKELVDEVFETTQSIPKCLNIVAMAKSAQRNNMAEEITQIKVPTALIWGLNDTITPPYVAHEFNRLMPNSQLFFIDKCCHAPMMERPKEFNEILEQFLKETHDSARVN